MRVKHLGEGWPQLVLVFPASLPSKVKETGRRGCKQSWNAELIKLALILTVILHPGCCGTSLHCTHHQAGAAPGGKLFSPKPARGFFIPRLKVSDWSKLSGKQAGCRVFLFLPRPACTASPAQGAERTLRATSLLAGLDCRVLLACGSKPSPFSLPFPEVHLAINGRFEFRRSLWGKNGLQ